MDNAETLTNNIVQLRASKVSDRVAAIKALQPQIHDPFVQAALLPLLEDRSARVQTYAANALAYCITAPDLHEHLFEVVRKLNANQYRALLLRLTIRRADANMRLVFLRILKEADTATLRRTIYSLSMSRKDRNSVIESSLVSLLDDPRIFIHIFNQLDGTEAETLIKHLEPQLANNEVRSTIVSMLIELMPPVQHSILKVLTPYANEPTIKLALLKAGILRVLTPYANEPNVKLALLNASEHQRFGISRALIELFALHPDDIHVREILLHYLIEDEEERLRELILKAFASHADEPEVQKALLYLLGEKTTETAFLAAQILQSQVDNPFIYEAIQPVIKAMNEPYSSPLVEQERQVLDKRLGLHDDHRHSFPGIARKLGIKSIIARSIVAKSREKLRHLYDLKAKGRNLTQEAEADLEHYRELVATDELQTYLDD